MEESQNEFLKFIQIFRHLSVSQSNDIRYFVSNQNIRILYTSIEFTSLYRRNNIRNDPWLPSRIRSNSNGFTSQSRRERKAKALSSRSLRKSNPLATEGRAYAVWQWRRTFLKDTACLRKRASSSLRYANPRHAWVIFHIRMGFALDISYERECCTTNV